MLVRRKNAASTLLLGNHRLGKCRPVRFHPPEFCCRVAPSALTRRAEDLRMLRSASDKRKEEGEKHGLCVKLFGIRVLAFGALLPTPQFSAADRAFGASYMSAVPTRQNLCANSDAVTVY